MVLAFKNITLCFGGVLNIPTLLVENAILAESHFVINLIPTEKNM